MRRTSRVVTVVVIAAVASGCAWKGGPQAVQEPDGADHWQPHPVAMRFAVPPRSYREASHGVLEVRLELLDEAHDPIKGAGRWSFVLYNIDERGLPSGAALYTWNLDMRTLDQNRERYDNVTGTYNFRLIYDELPPLPRGAILVAGLNPASGPQLRADARTAIH